MQVVIAGASGFLGSHLSTRLTEDGHDVTRLVRRRPESAQESEWQPDRGQVDADLIGKADAVVTLAGSPTAGNPHSTRWARELRESRVHSTEVLARAIAEGGGGAAFLVGNGISYYGDHGEDVVTEETGSRGGSLLTSVTRDWQAAAEPAVAAGSRVCVLRTAPVMDRRHPPMQMLKPLFQVGLGARLGSGRQHMAMISLRDWVGATALLVADDGASGPFNLCCPQTPTNAEFTRTLAAALGRKPLLFAPAAVMRRAAGAMAPELLGSINARPDALLARGYEFSDPDVCAVVAAGLG
jgi:uncharacterized protein (TIGR01777 family)